MKFTDGCRLMRPGVSARNAAEVVDVRTGGHRMTLHAPVKHVSDHGDTLNSPLLTVECRSPAEGVIGVRTTRHAGSLCRGPEFALPGAEPHAGKVHPWRLRIGGPDGVSHAVPAGIRETEVPYPAWTGTDTRPRDTRRGASCLYRSSRARSRAARARPGW